MQVQPRLYHLKYSQLIGLTEESPQYPHTIKPSYSKIFRALEIIHVKEYTSNAVLCYKYFQVMIFRLYAVYSKHEMKKIGNKTREKSQVLSQVLE